MFKSFCPIEWVNLRTFLFNEHEHFKFLFNHFGSVYLIRGMH